MHKICILAAALVLVFTLGACQKTTQQSGDMMAQASHLELGLNAYNDGDYKTALAQWQIAADQNDMRGQYFLGTLYLEGKGVKADSDKALELITLSAENGTPDAQLALVNFYTEEIGRAHV